MSAVGTVLRDRYEIIAELGRGGMSTVYLSRDKSLGSYWAVKQVKNNTNVDIEAFKKEVELLSNLNHSDIPRIVDRIEIEDDFFVVMDFIDGTSLGKKVLAEGPSTEKNVVEWAKMLCEILNYLHTVKDNPIIYRDMKPDNVMLTQSGRVKLIDFGIAKECKRGETQIGASIGTKGYAAPEQYKGGSNVLDERTDIYSLGATLYFLVTGILPGKPPHATRPVRQINPMLSEGIEYIIDKCTQDDPEHRYQNCKELLSDLDNIEILNSKYRKKMQNRLFYFIMSFMVSVLCLFFTIVGYNGIKKDRQDKYQVAYQKAMNYEKAAIELEKKATAEKKDELYTEARKEYIKAGEEYNRAIENKPSDLDAYLKLYNVLLPKKDSKDYIKETEMAIDALKGYVDKSSSPIYNNPTLLYHMVKKCLDVSDNQKIYAEYAVDYIQKIKKSNSYKNGDINKNEIDNLQVIAQYVAKDVSTQDFTALSNALIKLENDTDVSKLPPDNKLSTYFTIMRIYERYPNNLKDAYYRISEIGAKSKKIINENSQSDLITFNNIVPMYEIVASSLYESGAAAADVTAKRKMFTESLVWFGYLNDLNAELSEVREMKKGNAYKGIFDTYNSVEERSKIDSSVLVNLDNALKVYNNILKKNPQNFSAQVNITQVLLNKEIIKPAGERNFINVNEAYAKVLKIKNENKNLTTVQLSQFSSLKQQMINAGLEG